MRKHTPEPWEIDKNHRDTVGGAPIITAKTCWRNQKRRIAKVLFDFGSEDPEVHANARLIAAAPVGYRLAQTILTEDEDEMGHREHVLAWARQFMDIAEGRE